MINKLVIENIRHRWVRTFLCALVVGVQVMLILTLIGLSRGMLEDSAARAKGTNADIFLKPGAVMSLSAGQIDQKYRCIPRQAAACKAGRRGTTHPNSGGVDHHAQCGRYPNIRGHEWRFSHGQGKPPSQPDDLMVDSYYAKQHKLRVGQTWKVLKQGLANSPASCREACWDV